VKLNKRTTKLDTGNKSNLEQDALVALSASEYWPLLCTLADMMDMIADGTQAYCIIGATSNRSAFSVTMKVDGAGDSVYGSSFQEVAAATVTWL